MKIPPDESQKFVCIRYEASKSNVTWYEWLYITKWNHLASTWKSIEKQFHKI